MRIATSRLAALFAILRALPSPAGCAALIVVAAVFSAAESQSLDGAWQFVPDRAGNMSLQEATLSPEARTATVPGSWQAEFPDLRDYAGVVWYWRDVEGHKPGRGSVVLLRFEAVDYATRVFVNGSEVGSHEGGYLPFEVEVTKAWKSGKNRIAIRVADPGAAPSVVEGIDYAEIPHGKQNWYVQTSGPWRSITLEYRPSTRLKQVHITARADGSFDAEVRLIRAARMQGATAVSLVMKDATGAVVWNQQGSLPAGAETVSFQGRLEHPALWSPDHPSLYTLEAKLNSGDVAQYRFGFRTFESRDGKLTLNGQPIYLRGALDQDFYPNTIYSIPSAEYVKEEMRRAKALGLNALRCHLKVADPRYLDAADEVGLLIWYDLPNWDRLTDNSKRRGIETLNGMVERDWNHPSIVILTVINEAWGIDMKDESHRRWLKQTFDYARKTVPGWLVVDNSPCCDNYHIETDVLDFHQYNAVPDFAQTFAQVVNEFAHRAQWLYSPYGDARSTGREPLVLSEFGNWGLPELPEPKPWWFSRDFKSNEITLPAGVEKRFSDFKLDTVFRDLPGLIRQTQDHELLSLKYEIETIRSHPQIQGYIVTELTDVNWEANGLLDMWRRPKSFAASLASLQKDDLVIIRPERRNYVTGERVTAEVVLSHYGSTNWPAGKIQWDLADSRLSGKLSSPLLACGEAVTAGWIDFVAPPVNSFRRAVLRVRVIADGSVVAENSTDLFLYPRSIPDDMPLVRIHDPSGSLRRFREAIKARNYHLAPESEARAILLTSAFDDFTKKALENAATVVLLPSGPQSIAPGVDVLPRTNTNYDGNWISGFLWTRNTGPFRGLAMTPLAGFEAEVAAPTAVVRGIPASAFSDVLSGIFYGWIHANVGALVQARAAKGTLIICTFNLANSYGADPYGTYLFDALVNYAGSGIQPEFRLDLMASPSLAQ